MMRHWQSYKYFLKYWRSYSFGIVLLLIVNLLAAYIPKLVKKAIDLIENLAQANLNDSQIASFSQNIEFVVLIIVLCAFVKNLKK